MEDPRLQALLNQLDTIFLVLERPIVQRQLAAFLVVFVLAWLLPIPFRQVIQRLSARRLAAARKVGQAQLPVTWRGRLLRWARALEYVIFPVLGLLLSQLAVQFFDMQSWPSGLLKRLIPLFWLVLAFRLIGGALFATLQPEAARNYHRRFVTPLFIILIVVIFSTNLAGTFPIGEIELLVMMETSITLRSIAIAVVVLYLFLASAWIVRDALSKVVLPRTEADPGVANTITTTTYYVIMAVGVLASVSTLGFDLSALAIIGGGLSVGIGFGLQELVANFVSGILLLFEQSLRPGDVIEVSGERGTVSQLRMRATVLRTIDNVEIFVPNKTLLTSVVATYTHTDRLVRRSIAVGVSYDSDPTEVRDILLHVADSHGLVLKEPEPVVFFKGFGASSLEFEVAVWISDPPCIFAILSDLHFMIFREFRKHKIEIPFPQRDLHLRSGLPQASTAQQNGADRQQTTTSDEPRPRERMPISKPNLP